MTREAAAPVDIGAFCREVEAHLCRVNGGHLVRIVGPAFELVAGWAREGLPLRVVLHGVDRTVARLTAKGPRRRPVRIEFCEADVRDACDQWRKAVGVRAAAGLAVPGSAEASGDQGRGEVPPSAGRMPSLPKHLERVMLRLSSVVATRELPGALASVLDGVLREVESCLHDARGARGPSRRGLIERLASVEQAMTAAAVDALDGGVRSDLEAQAARELAPYRGQMPGEALREASGALLGELARRHFGLPQVRIDG